MEGRERFPVPLHLSAIRDYKERTARSVPGNQRRGQTNREDTVISTHHRQNILNSCLRQENKVFTFGLECKIHRMDSGGLVGQKPPSYS